LTEDGPDEEEDDDVPKGDVTDPVANAGDIIAAAAYDDDGIYARHHWLAAAAMAPMIPALTTRALSGPPTSLFAMA
jgi:hypothetical protein